MPKVFITCLTMVASSMTSTWYLLSQESHLSITLQVSSFPTNTSFAYIHVSGPRVVYFSRLSQDSFFFPYLLLLVLHPFHPSTPPCLLRLWFCSTPVHFVCAAGFQCRPLQLLLNKGSHANSIPSKDIIVGCGVVWSTTIGLNQGCMSNIYFLSC